MFSALTVGKNFISFYLEFYNPSQAMMDLIPSVIPPMSNLYFTITDKYVYMPGSDLILDGAGGRACV